MVRIRITTTPTQGGGKRYQLSPHQHLILWNKKRKERELCGGGVVAGGAGTTAGVRGQEVLVNSTMWW